VILTCQSQLNCIGQEVQFLALVNLGPTFVAPWVNFDSSRLFCVSLFSFLPDFCFISACWPYPVLILICAEWRYFSCPVGAAGGIWFHDCTIRLSVSDDRHLTSDRRDQRNFFICLSLHPLKSVKKYFRHTKMKHSFRQKLLSFCVYFNSDYVSVCL
jgi:hypothetical protein